MTCRTNLFHCARIRASTYALCPATHQDGVYVYGLFLEGASWDKKKKTITDQQPVTRSARRLRLCIHLSHSLAPSPLHSLACTPSPALTHLHSLPCAYSPAFALTPLNSAKIGSDVLPDACHILQSYAEIRAAHRPIQVLTIALVSSPPANARQPQANTKQPEAGAKQPVAHRSAGAVCGPPLAPLPPLCRWHRQLPLHRLLRTDCI